MMRLLLILLALAGPALAQQPSPEALAAARALVEAAGGPAQIDTVIIAMRGQLITAIRRGNPALTETNVTALVDEFLMPEIRAGAPEILDFSARSWAERMTAQELRDVAAIFNTPIGRRLIEVQPQIAVQALQFGQQWGQRIANAAIAKHRDALRARGLNL